jgi:hypothetical protein
MASQAQMFQWRDAVQEALNSLDAAARYDNRQRTQRTQRRGRRGADARPRPLEFDAGGFPVPQRTPSFSQRTTRLISDS